MRGTWPDPLTAIMDGGIPGDILAQSFGLNPRYFSRVDGRETLNEQITVMRFTNVVLVSLPPEARQYIRDHVATPIYPGDDETKYDYILQLTSKMKIGFWK